MALTTRGRRWLVIGGVLLAIVVVAVISLASQPRTVIPFGGGGVPYEEAIAEDDANGRPVDPYCIEGECSEANPARLHPSTRPTPVPGSPIPSPATVLPQP
jgi:hypothetical protein